MKLSTLPREQPRQDVRPSPAFAAVITPPVEQFRTAAGPRPVADAPPVAGSIHDELPRESLVLRGLWRTMEVAIAVVALALTWPIMLVLAAIVRLDSPGPAVFRQTRVGRGGKHFTFIKFRTMYVDARQRYPELYAYDYSDIEVRTLKFKREADPRITPAGQWLRKSTLDELPNFWNLLLGEIALVGPRPEIPEMVRHYRPDQMLKFAVKPGITGFAQTHGRGNLSFQDTIAYDIDYVRRRSVATDIRIIARTVRMVVTLDGAF